MARATNRRRRRPRQARAQQTVEALLDAVARVIKRHGVDAVTTNRIAVAAGISIGSVYQYFPDKAAIFVALHERHVDEIARALEAALVAHAEAPLAGLVAALVDVMVASHSVDPELHELLFREVPHRAEGARGFVHRLRGALRLALLAKAAELPSGIDLDRAVFMVAHMIEGLSHAAVLERPVRLSLAAAKREVIRAVLAYLRAGTGPERRGPRSTPPSD
jgi:AcrR family transcriptional regulator